MLLVVHLHAVDTKTASKIFNKIFTEIISKNVVFVYTENEEYKEVIKQAPDLHLATTIYMSHIILVTSLQEIPVDSDEHILFSTSYAVFRQNKSVIGVFYWKNGRIKIEFLKSRLNKHHIELSESFEQFVVDEI